MASALVAHDHSYVDGSDAARALRYTACCMPPETSRVTSVQPAGAVRVSVFRTTTWARSRSPLADPLGLATDTAFCWAPPLPFAADDEALYVTSAVATPAPSERVVAATAPNTTGRSATARRRRRKGEEE